MWLRVDHVFDGRSIEIHSILRNDPPTPRSCDDSFRLDRAGRPKSGQEVIQAPIQEMHGRYLRVVLLADGETVHNVLFDRSFRP
jgi:hypothetical protein